MTLRNAGKRLGVSGEAARKRRNAVLRALRAAWELAEAGREPPAPDNPAEWWDSEDAWGDEDDTWAW